MTTRKKRKPAPPQTKWSLENPHQRLKALKLADLLMTSFTWSSEQACQRRSDWARVYNDLLILAGDRGVHGETL